MAKILIVDDSATMREIIMRGIRQAGFKVESFAEARDGAAGLASLAEGGVDLILSDVNMPNMDGLAFVENVRAQHGKATPIVMIMSEGIDEVVAAARARGATGHIERPCLSDQIQEILGKHLS